ncbi:hypothetical protein H4I96_01101 [Botrytis cinerea]
MARTSARSVSRDLPSSPPTKSTNPVPKTTRLTRSQSVELDFRIPRQESVEGTGDKNEQQNSRSGRKAAGKRAPGRRADEDPEAGEQADDEEDREAGEQAKVDEDSEAGEQADDEEDPEADQDEEDLDTTKVASGQEYDSEDEGRSDFSDDTRTTSHTKRVMQIINSRSAIETLPDLYDTAKKIINKSTKKGIRPKEMGRHLKALESISNELEVYKEPYGREQFIEVDIVLEKVSGSLNSTSLGSSDLGGWAAPFTAILQSANLATLLGQVIQLREGNEVSQEELMLFLQSLEKMFPRPFVSKFAAPKDYGSESSRLINETHTIMLEIRTQLFELTARQKKDTKTGERVDIIRSMFLPPAQAKDSGSYVDFERLNKSFPRSKFFNDLVDYGEKRWAEVDLIVESRGGIDNVMVPFEEVVKDIQSDAEEETAKSDQPDSEPEIRVDYEPEVLEREDSTTSERGPQASAPRTKKDFHDNPSAITKLVSLRKLAGSRTSGGIEVGSSIPAPSQPEEQQDSQITQNFKKYSDSQNKENKSPEQPQVSRGRPLITTTSKRSGMYRKHSNAQKVVWVEDSQGFPIDSQADDPGPSQPRNNKRKVPPYLQADNEVLQPAQPKTNKRKAHAADILSDDEGHNSDEDFQTDQRNTEPRRRIAVPKSSARPSKRPRTEVGESSLAQDSRSRKNSKEASSPEFQSNDDDHSEDQGFEADQNVPKLKPQRSKKARTEAGENSQGQISSRKIRSPSPILASNNDDEEQNQEGLEQQNQHRKELSRSPQFPEDDEGSVQMPQDEQPGTIAHSFTQASARSNVIAQAIKNGFGISQTRTPWSDKDTQLLIDYIGEKGPMWKEIEKSGDQFERDNITQVGLKDKARNIKVDILLAGQILPRNFTGVKLNANLIKRVKRTWPNYDPYTDTGYATF